MESVFKKKKDNNSMLAKFSEYFDAEKMCFKLEVGSILSLESELKPKEEDLSLIKEIILQQNLVVCPEIILSLGLCLWKTREYNRKNFYKNLPKILNSVFLRFTQDDSLRILGFLHKVKQYESIDEVNALVDGQDWGYISKEFDSVCENFVKNISIMKEIYRKRTLWAMFKDSLEGRMNGTGISQSGEGIAVLALGYTNDTPD